SAVHVFPDQHKLFELFLRRISCRSEACRNQTQCKSNNESSPVQLNRAHRYLPGKTTHLAFRFAAVCTSSIKLSRFFNAVLPRAQFASSLLKSQLHPAAWPAALE